MKSAKYLGLLLIFSTCLYSIAFSQNEYLTDSKFAVKELSIRFKESIINRDEKKLVSLLPPNDGLIFRYLGYNETVLSRDDCSSLYSDNKIRFWGVEDGSGEEIKCSFKDKWLPLIRDIILSYDEVGYNHFIRVGCSLNREIENTYFIDFTSIGKESKYEGLDWHSLRLFFRRINGKWYLVAIDIYNWTI